MRTEEEITKEIRKLYAEKSKIRQKVWAEYVGKCYLINARYYFIDKVLDRAFSVLIVDDDGIVLTEIETNPDQLNVYEIEKDLYIKVLESKVDLFIKQVKEK